jgi:hypothetical protein
MLVKAVIAQLDDESPFHVFPTEVLELFWQDLVDLYFFEKEKLEWPKRVREDMDLFF